MHGWLTDLQQWLARGDPVVLVTIARTEGPTPREAGTRMIVGRDVAAHSIGGGRFEAKAVELARQVLKDGMRRPRLRRLERLALGPELGQCGGGAVTLAFEWLDISDLGWVTSLAKRLAAREATVRSVSFGTSGDAVLLSEPEPGASAGDCLLWHGTGFADDGALLTETIAPRSFAVVLCGAGPVGHALVRVLATLSCQVRWVDRRDAPFPAAAGAQVMIDPRVTPGSAIDEAAPDTCFIVATHDDALDIELAARILRRGDAAFIGVHGSPAKRTQLEHRLAAAGIDPARVARIRCPLGIDGIADQSPEIVAIAATAQLLQAVDARARGRSTHAASIGRDTYR